MILLVPSISAIESGSFKENATDSYEKGLIYAINKKIEQLKVQDSNPRIILKDDPDGPNRGGLDDIYDWMDLFFGLQFGRELVKMFKSQWVKKAFASGNIIQIALCIIVYGLYTHSTITSLGDAFDITDSDRDGY